MGKLEATQEALALLEYFRLCRPKSVMTVQDIRTELPDLKYAPGFQALAGLLLVPLSVGGNDFIVFFRKGQLREVKWAGNPYEKFLREGTEGYLEPRKSFKMWSEMVVGRSREWTEEQIETAAVLCLVYGKFIEVWRQKEAVIQNSQLTRLLLANSAHEVRTPLNAIINYLEIALEGSLDPETRDNLSKSHSASKSLIYVINDLLDLTKTEEGKNLIREEIFDLQQAVQEATDMFVNDAKRKNLEYEVVNNPGVPHQVLGDQRRVRQAISNVVANAIEHTSEGSVRVETWLVNVEESRAEVDIAVQDTGVGMSPKKLDDLFGALEQIQTEDFDAVSDATPEPQSATEQPQGPLGLGLAFVSRLVRNMNGQLRLKSEEGKGSRFVIQLSFELPEPTSRPTSKHVQSLKLNDSTDLSRDSPMPTTPPITEGEVMLVQHNASGTSTKPMTPTRPGNELTRRDSGGSMHSAHSNHSQQSLGSFKSGSSTKSDVDRLIEAIQEPQMVDRARHATSPEGARLGRIGASTAGQSSSSLNSPRLQRHASTTSRSSIDTGQLSRGGAKAGEANVTDQGVPVKPVRAVGVGDSAEPATPLKPKSAGRVSFLEGEVSSTAGPSSAASLQPDGLRVLVAEDDPINSKIMHKRLQKFGHQVHLTINGEACASAHSVPDAGFDVVLMDIQVSFSLGS